MSCCRMCPVSVLGDRGFRGLEGPLLRNHGVTVEVKHRDRLPGEFSPIRPLWRVWRGRSRGRRRLRLRGCRLRASGGC
jgi:hypothetical protein